MPLVQDVVETHPGLTFLKEAAEFHSRYVHTVRFHRPLIFLNLTEFGLVSALFDKMGLAFHEH